MNIDKVTALFNAISKAGALVVDSSPLLSDWSITQITGDPENELVYFSWMDDDGEYNEKLTEEDLDLAQVEGNKIIIMDGDMVDFEITVFDLTPALICIPANKPKIS